MYFIAKLRLRVVLNFLCPPKPDQYMPYFDPLLPASTKFRENTEILRKSAILQIGSKFRVARKSVVPMYLVRA